MTASARRNSWRCGWARDKTLAMPALILPSVQVNIRAGQMPPKDANGQVYLRLPVDRL